jgi:hypothetical protein
VQQRHEQLKEQYHDVSEETADASGKKSSGPGNRFVEQTPKVNGLEASD